MPQTPVQPFLHRAPHRWLRAAGVTLASLLLITCSSDSPVGPNRPGVGNLRVAPVFDAFARVAPLTLDNVRVIVVRPPAETLAVVPRQFNPNSNQLQLSIPVFLTSISEDLLVTLELYSGTTLLFSGTRTLRVSQGSATPPDSVPVTYQGPGSQVASVVITPRDTTLSTGASFSFTVSAADAQAQPVAQYYVSWSAPGAPAGASIDGAGRLTAPTQRDTFFVKVVTPNGVMDSTSVIIAAAPATLVKSGGDGQTALVGTALPQQLAVLVNGTDGLPVPGATVTFAPGIGGGSVDSATATTDASGIARSGAVLGNTVGAQTFIASATGLTSVTFNETGVSGSGTITWTGATSTDWNTAGNWNPALVPTPTSDVVIPSGTVRAALINNNVTVRNLTVQTGATLTTNDISVAVNGNLDVSGNLVGCCGDVITLATGTLRGNFNQVLLDLSAGGVVTLNGNTLLTSSDVQIAGTLILNGHTLDLGLAGGQVMTSGGTGVLTMTNAADQLIARNTVFSGGDETGHLTAGSLSVGGNFSQTGPGTSFVASGNHTVLLSGAGAQTINFATPGFAAAHFQNVIVANSAGLVQATSDLYATGTAGVTPTAVRTLSGNGSTLFTTILNVSNFTFNNLLLNFAGSTVVTFDTVTFQGYAPTATPLTIAHPGAAAPLAFQDVTFAVTPTTGFYLKATDSNPSDGVPLVIDMFNPTPISAGSFVQTTGATVNWPASGAAPGTWTGAVDTSWTNAGNWGGGTVPTTVTDVVIPAGTPHAPTITTVANAHNLTVQSGATLAINLGGLNLSGSLDAQGTITGTTTSVNLTGTGTVRGTLTGTVFTTLVNGTYSLAGRYVTPGMMVNGTLTLAGFTASVGSSAGDDFITSNNGVLVMTNAADSLIVGGTGPSVVFDGGSTAGTLTAGVLLMNSGSFSTFSQGNTFNASSFAPSGSHKVVFAGAGSINVTMNTPGAGSAFNILDLSAQAGGVSLATPIRVDGLLISTPVSTPPAINGGNRLLTAAGGTQITGLTLTNAPFRMSGGGVQFDNVTFQSMVGSAIQLSVDDQGAAPLTFNNLVFSTVPTTGLYLAANDVDGATSGVLTVNLVNPTPATPGSFTSVAGGAVINWPAIGSRTWTGTTSTDWFVATNWSPAGVPTATDNVVIPSAPVNQPLVTNVGAVAKSLTVNSGATLTLNGFQFTVSGNLFADSPIANPGSVVMNATGQVRGSLPTFSIQNSAVVTAVGPVTTAGNFQIAGSGTNFVVGGQTIVVNGNFTMAGQLTMANPADSLAITGNVTFNGLTETGLLTDGKLVIGGNFIATGAGGEAFTASANHTTILTGATVTVNLGTPGTGPNTSQFSRLVKTSAGSLILNSDIFATRSLQVTTTGAETISAGTTHVITTPDFTSSASTTTFDNVPLVLSSSVSTPLALSNVTFQNMPVTATQLTVDNPGSASPFVFDRLTFSTTPTTGGLYLHANDTDGASPNVLTISLTNPTPATDGGFSSATNGAVISWPGSAPPVTWTGAVSTDWNTAGNWSPAQVPTSTDDVVIPGGTPTPTSAVSVFVRNLTVQSGGITGSMPSLRTASDLTVLTGGTIGGFTGIANVGGNLLVQSGGTIGPITSGIVVNGSSTVSQGVIQCSVTANFINQTVQGSFGPAATALIIAGTNVTASGPITANGLLDVPGLNFTLNGQSVTASSLNVRGLGYLTMTNPADQLTVSGNASFDGATELNFLSAGILTIGGDFAQNATNSADAFHSSGTHLTIFTGASPTLNFATPGNVPGSSHFEQFRWTGTGTMTLASDVFAHGTMDGNPGISGTIASVNHKLQVGAFVSGGATFSGTSLVIDQPLPLPVVLDNVTFTGMSSTVNQLTVNHTGIGGPFTLNNLTFANAPTTGFYLSANDLDGSTSGFLTIDVAGSSPASGAPFVQQLNGAVVNWPPAIPPITWTGAISTDWSNAGNWSPAQVPTAADDVVIPATTLKPAITSTCAAKSILVNSGGRIDLGTLNCQVSGNVISNGIIAGTTGAIQIVAAGQISGNFPNLIASAPVTVVGSTGLGSGNGNVTITGVGASLTMNGQTLVMPGNLSVQGAGVLIMNNPADVLTVQGGATFDGGSESGLLTAGRLTVAGNFSQAATSSGASFFASGNHLTVLSGTSSSVSFATSGLSRFQELDVTSKTGTLTLGSNITVAGTLISAPSAANGPVISGVGFTLTAGGAGIDAPQGITALTMDGVPLVLSGGSPVNVANLTFQNQSQIGTALTVNNAGTAAPITLVGLNFIGSLTAGGFWIQANDLDGIAPFLTVDVIGASPASGAGVSQANNGAIINWPPVGSLVWTGTVSQDWSTAANWDLNRVPTAVDDATINSGTPFQPKLSVSSAINNLTIQAGAIVDLDTTIMVVGGNLDNNGSIVGVVGTAGLSLVGTAKTVHGTIGVDVVIAPADYTLNGNLDVQSLSIAGANGSLTLAGHQLTTIAGFSTLNNGTVIMTNPADALVVGGLALFGGGDETGKLTAGLLQIGGDFNQVGLTSQSSFAASGTHLTNFNGAGLQTISMTDTTLSFFQNLNVANGGGGVDVQSLLAVHGNLDVVTGTTVVAPNTGPFFPGFNVSNNVTLQGGTSVSASRLFVGGTLSVSGTYNVFQTIFTGFGQTAPSNLPYQQLWAYGTVTMAPGPLAVSDLVASFPVSQLVLSGPTSVSGNINLGNLGGGNLKLNGQQVIVAGTLTVDQASTLTMQSPSDSLVVGGIANFIGGSETGLMTAGVLELHGGLKQTAANSVTSFAPSGTHKTVINSATAQQLDFASPGLGAAGSHFQILDLSGATGGAGLTNNSFADSVISTTTAAKLSGGGKSLTMRRAQISGLTSDLAPLVLDEQGAFSTENLSNINFQSFTGGNNLILSITGPGSSLAARPAVTTTNVNFPTLGIGANNLYVKLVSSNAATFVMTMTGSNQSPQVGGNGPTLSNPANQTSVSGAQILWP